VAESCRFVFSSGQIIPLSCRTVKILGRCDGEGHDCWLDPAIGYRYLSKCEELNEDPTLTDKLFDTGEKKDAENG
jgi:hypothetical protein